MVLGERVSEAQRAAVREMKDLHEKRGTKGSVLIGRKHGSRSAGGKRGRDGMDQEEG